MTYDLNWPENRYQSLLAMSKERAWKPYAWQECKRLENEYPDLFGGITERLKQDMESYNGQKKGGESNE